MPAVRCAVARPPTGTASCVKTRKLPVAPWAAVACATNRTVTVGLDASDDWGSHESGAGRAVKATPSADQTSAVAPNARTHTRHAWLLHCSPRPNPWLQSIAGRPPFVPITLRVESQRALWPALDLACRTRCWERSSGPDGRHREVSR